MTVRSGGVLAVSTAALALMACAHTPVGYQMPSKAAGEGVVVVTAYDAEKTKLPAWSASMPLGEDEDQSVLKFLSQADASGAKYLSDVSVVYAAEDNGKPMECRTHLLPVVAVESKRVMGTAFPRNALQRTPGTSVTVGTANRPAVPVSTYGSQTNQYVYTHLTDVPHYDQEIQVKRWRLLKADPECKAFEGTGPLAERVEGRAYGCDGGSCQDKTL